MEQEARTDCWAGKVAHVSITGFKYRRGMLNVDSDRNKNQYTTIELSSKVIDCEGANLFRLRPFLNTTSDTTSVFFFGKNEYAIPFLMKCVILPAGISAKIRERTMALSGKLGKCCHTSQLSSIHLQSI